MYKPAKGVGNAGETGPVAIGAVLPIARDTQHDQPWIDGTQDIPAQPPFFQCAGAEILTKHIRLRDELLDNLYTFRRAKVECQ